MQEALAHAMKAARSESSVTFVGEPGTGKRLFARFLHEQSSRCGKRFLTLSAGAGDESWLLGELCGTVGGAPSRLGLLAMATGGTLLIEDVADLPLPLQAKVATVLREQTYVPVGADTPFVCDVRILATTREPLRVAFQAGRLNDDLYARLSALEIGLAPLRDRTEDIPLLVEHFVEQYRHLTGRLDVTRITERALDKLSQEEWPANIRSLESTIERSLLLAPIGSIDVDDLVFDRPSRASAAPASILPPMGSTFARR